MLPFNLYLLIVLFVSFVVYRFMTRRTRDLLSKLPGTKWIPILGTVRSQWSKSKAVPPLTYFFQQQVGVSLFFKKEKLNLFWFGNNPVLFLQAPETVEAIMSSNTALEKGQTYRFLVPWLGDGLLISSGAKWKNHRKLLTPSFHFRILEKFAVVMNEHASVLVSKLKEAWSNSDSVDAFAYYSKCTLDIIFETSMGMKVGAQERDSEFSAMIQKAGYGVSYRTAKPWLATDFLFKLTKEGKSFYEAVDYLHNVTEKVITEKIKNKAENPVSSSESDPDMEFGAKKKLAFIDLILESELTMSEIREQVDTFIFAGHDTTATALFWMTYLVGLHPDVQEKLLQEIDDIFGDDKERHVTQDDLRQLKYMECVMKECQRVYPAVPDVSRTLDKDTMIGGYMVPKGTECDVIIYMVHHDEKHYPNPEVFDPERFNPENSVGRHPYAYIPFSAGARNCIGQRFALMEQKIIMCHILRNFTLLSLDPRDKIKLYPELVLRTASPVRSKFIPK